MWILVRLALAAAAFLVRQKKGPRAGAASGHHDGMPYFVRLSRTKAKIRRFSIGAALRTPWFRLTPEGGLDRFFKTAGIACEAESGDPEFDQRVYVAGDHPAIHELLRRSGEARAAIQEAFAAGFSTVHGDGVSLWLDHPDGREPRPDELQLLARLRAALVELESHPMIGLRDPFLWKTIAIEGVLWSIAAYAAGGVIEAVANKEDYHLHRAPLIGYGLLVALLFFALVFSAVLLFLWGSSRGHRLVIESAILLALSLPVLGVQAVSDVNRGFDRAEPSVVTRTIARAEHRRSRRSSSYYIYLAPAPAGQGPALPDRIRVARATYARASAGRLAEVHVAPGFLGLPWYREILILRGPAP